MKSIEKYVKYLFLIDLRNCFNKVIFCNEILIKKMKIPTLISAFKCGFDITHNDGIEYIEIEEDVMKMANVKEPYIIEVSGNSMTPTLNHKDLLIVDRKDIGKHNDIVAVYLNGEHHVKRLNMNHDGIALVSDNKEHETKYVKDDDDFTILGTVKVMCRKMK